MICCVGWWVGAWTTKGQERAKTTTQSCNIPDVCVLYIWLTHVSLRPLTSKDTNTTKPMSRRTCNAFNYTRWDPLSQWIIPFLRESTHRRIMSRARRELADAAAATDQDTTPLDPGAVPTLDDIFQEMDAADACSAPSSPSTCTPPTPILSPTTSSSPSAVPLLQLDPMEEDTLTEIQQQWNMYYDEQHWMQRQQQHDHTQLQWVLSTRINGWHSSWLPHAIPPYITIHWEGSGKLWCSALSQGNAQCPIDHVHRHTTNILGSCVERLDKVANRWMVKVARKTARKDGAVPPPLLTEVDDSSYKANVMEIWRITIANLLNVWYRNRFNEAVEYVASILSGFGVEFILNTQWSDVCAHCGACGKIFPISYTSKPGQPWKVEFSLCLDHFALYQLPTAPL